MCSMEVLRHLWSQLLLKATDDEMEEWNLNLCLHNMQSLHWLDTYQRWFLSSCVDQVTARAFQHASCDFADCKINWRCWLATSMRQWLPHFTSIPLTTPMIWGYPERNCHKRLLCKEENLLPDLLDWRNYCSHIVTTEMPLVQAGIGRKLCPNHTSSLWSDTNQWDNQTCLNNFAFNKF